MNQAKQYELDGKTYYVIDDEITYKVFDSDYLESENICDMCVDGQEKDDCPTAVALNLKQKPCEYVILNDEGYAHYIAKRMTGKWWEE